MALEGLWSVCRAAGSRQLLTEEGSGHRPSWEVQTGNGCWAPDHSLAGFACLGAGGLADTTVNKAKQAPSSWNIKLTEGD